MVKTQKEKIGTRANIQKGRGGAGWKRGETLSLSINTVPNNPFLMKLVPSIHKSAKDFHILLHSSPCSRFSFLVQKLLFLQDTKEDTQATKQTASKDHNTL